MQHPPITNEISLRENLESNKFIQLEIKGQPYLRFIRPTDVRDHFDIFSNTLIEEFGIIPEFQGPIPKVKGDNYELVGAGLFKYKEDLITLYGQSDDYQIGPNKKHATKISKLTGLEIIVQ